MEMKKSKQDALIYTQMIKPQDSSWIAFMCDRFYDLSHPQKKNLLTYFIELDIGDKKWEGYFQDEALWLKCWSNIVYYFTGRPEVRGEPDQSEFYELLKEYFGSELYETAKSETSEDKIDDFATLLED